MLHRCNFIDMWEVVRPWFPHLLCAVPLLLVHRYICCRWLELGHTHTHLTQRLARQHPWLVWATFAIYDLCNIFWCVRQREVHCAEKIDWDYARCKKSIYIYFNQVKIHTASAQLEKGAIYIYTSTYFPTHQRKPIVNRYIADKIVEDWNIQKYHIFRTHTLLGLGYIYKFVHITHIILLNPLSYCFMNKVFKALFLFKNKKITSVIFGYYCFKMIMNYV